MLKIVIFGGGKGHAQLVEGLKNEDVHITSVVTVTDRGSSTGKIRTSYKLGGHIGDCGRVVIAARRTRKDKTAEEKMKMLDRALNHRFKNGLFGGHTPRNIILAALQLANSINPTEACEVFGEALNSSEIPKNVDTLPVTNTKADVRYILLRGKLLDGEDQLDSISDNYLYDEDLHIVQDVLLIPAYKNYPPEKPSHAAAKKVQLRPILASRAVLKAIREADLIIIAPGDLFTSILPVLVAVGIKEAIQACRAKILVMLNIMTKKGETQGFTAETFVDWYEKKVGRSVDMVAANMGMPVRAKSVLGDYDLENKVKLPTDILRESNRYVTHPFAKLGYDSTARKYTLQHDPVEVCKFYREKVLPILARPVA